MTDAVWSWNGSGWTKVAGGPAGESDLGCPNGIDLTGASGHPLLLTFPADIGFDATRQRVLIPSDGDQALKIVGGGGS